MAYPVPTVFLYPISSYHPKFLKSWKGVETFLPYLPIMGISSFSSLPSPNPIQPIAQIIQFLNWKNSGCSIILLSHYLSLRYFLKHWVCIWIVIWPRIWPPISISSLDSDAIFQTVNGRKKFIEDRFSWYWDIRQREHIVYWS